MVERQKRYEMVADPLRVAILSRRLRPGDRLPTVSDLAKQHGVSKATVEHGIRVLKEEGLVHGEQGRGTFVTAHLTAIDHLERRTRNCFEEDEVSIDCLDLTLEPIVRTLCACLEEVRAGRFKTRNVNVRVLTPDYSTPWALPSQLGKKGDAALRKRHREAAVAQLDELHGALTLTSDQFLLNHWSLAVKELGSPLPLRVYNMNRRDLLVGTGSLTKSRQTIGGERTTVLGLDTETADVHRLDGVDALAGQFISLFNSYWEFGRTNRRWE